MSDSHDGAGGPPRSSSHQVADSTTLDDALQSSEPSSETLSRGRYTSIDEPAQPDGPLMASVITGRSLVDLMRQSLHETYYDGTLIAGSPRRTILDESMFDEQDDDKSGATDAGSSAGGATGSGGEGSGEDESYAIAPIPGGDSPDAELEPAKLGTFAGVWVRCMGNMFGVIMFLRVGWVVGQAGIGLGLVIIFLSASITALTTMSMSAVATNGKVKGGGAYFLISRSVGPALGTAIGVLFTLGQMVAVAMYIIGFCETMVDMLGVPAPATAVEVGLADTVGIETTAAPVYSTALPDAAQAASGVIFSFTNDFTMDVRIWGIILLSLQFVMLLIGIGWVVKLQIVLLALVVLSALSAMIGAGVGPDAPVHAWNPASDAAPGFKGFGDPNGTCVNYTTTCADVEGWYASIGGASINCSSTDSVALCGGSSVFGSSDGGSQCVAAADACCTCGGGETVESGMCLQWVTNVAANFGPAFTCDGPSANWYNGSPGECWTFFSVFAIFFPAVTGIMAGANISALLKSPEKSLPSGTFHSVMDSTLVYAILGIVLGAAATREELIGNYLVMQAMELTIFLISLGIYAGTFSAALTSLSGAPQLLAAVAADGLLPCLKVFSQMHHRVGFCPKRSLRSRRTVSCFRPTPYVTDGLHPFFARRIKLYLFRHVFARVVDLSDTEFRILSQIDSPSFTDPGVLADNLNMVRDSSPSRCASCAPVSESEPAKLKAALLDELLDLRRLPSQLREQVKALMRHLDVNLAHYDSERCTVEELRSLLFEQQMAGDSEVDSSADKRPPVLKSRQVNSGMVPAEVVHRALQAFAKIASTAPSELGVDSDTGDSKLIELVEAGHGSDGTTGRRRTIHCTDELLHVTFDCEVWRHFRPLPCVKTVTGEDVYDALLPVQYGFVLAASDPIVGYVLSFIIAAGCVLIGTLNAIAPIISMFFLITYGMLNLACALQVLSKNPGWRPAFKYYHWTGSMFGAILCVAAMLVMEWISSVITLVLAAAIAAIVHFLPHEDTVGNWGDATEAAKHMAIRRNLLGLRRSKFHPKTFRPSYLMVFDAHPSKNTRSRNLARVAYTLRKGYGTTHVGIVKLHPKGGLYGTRDSDKEIRTLRHTAAFYKMYDRDSQRDEFVDRVVSRRMAAAPEPAPSELKEQEEMLRAQVEREERGRVGCKRLLQECRRSQDRMWAMVDYVNAPNFRHGARQLMQLCGVGPLRPNTVLAALPEASELDCDVLGVDVVLAKVERLYYQIHDGMRMGMSVVVASLRGHHMNFYDPVCLPARSHACDMWWVMDDGGFQMLVPHLLMLSDYWRTVTAKSKVRTRYCAVNNTRLSAALEARARHRGLLDHFGLQWPMEIIPLERHEDGKQLVQLEDIAAPVVEQYNAIPYAENLEDQDLTEHQRQVMIRWLAVVAVMQEESCDTNLVCSLLPHTRRWIKPRNYVALLEVLSSITDKDGDQVPVFLSRGNSTVPTTEFQ